jgi:hypothetical protein
MDCPELLFFLWVLHRILHIYGMFVYTQALYGAAFPHLEFWICQELVKQHVQTCRYLDYFKESGKFMIAYIKQGGEKVCESHPSHKQQVSSWPATGILT